MGMSHFSAWAAPAASRPAAASPVVSRFNAWCFVVNMLFLPPMFELNGSSRTIADPRLHRTPRPFVRGSTSPCPSGYPNRPGASSEGSSSGFDERGRPIARWRIVGTERTRVKGVMVPMKDAKRPDGPAGCQEGGGMWDADVARCRRTASRVPPEARAHLDPFQAFSTTTTPGKIDMLRNFDFLSGVPRNLLRVASAAPCSSMSCLMKPTIPCV